MRFSILTSGISMTRSSIITSGSPVPAPCAAAAEAEADPSSTFSSAIRLVAAAMAAMAGALWTAF